MLGRVEFLHRILSASRPMSDNNNMMLKVKLLRSRKIKRVIWLECGKDFADFLLSLLVMPVGLILKHLEEGGLVRSDDKGVFNLYASMKHLEESVFTVDRKRLIDPVMHGGYSNDILRLTFVETGKCLNLQCENETQSKGQVCDDCEAVNWNSCLNVRRPDRNYKSKLFSCLASFNSQTYGDATRCPHCQQGVGYHAVVLRRKGVQTSSEQATTSSRSGDGETTGGGFVERNITFMVKDDLTIIKSSALSALALIQSMKSEFCDLDMKEVDVGKKEGLLLVRASMVSKTPLTDVFESIF